MGMPKASVICCAIRGHPQLGFRCFMSTMAATTSWLGPLGAGLHGSIRREQPAILPLNQHAMHVQQRRWFEDNRGTDQPARADEDRTQTGDQATRGTEIGRPFSRTVEDQQLVLDEHGFGHHSAGAPGTRKSGNGRQQMQKQDGQIAHRRILPRS
jgi:hypothetical protein